ncbi:MAG: SusC/RagA family TonB-linked outer membrane protein, partial [Bacteroidales bacterium]|nr:SusC/RagA family TonB-linked outer membrane protein [Bacteroidales bacterium]
MIVSLIFLGGTLFAQNSTVTGVVRDDKGEALEGVTVIVEGTNNATATDALGKYSINAAATASLRFSFIGYKETVVPINGRTVVNATMSENSLLLDNIVVTALGIKKEAKSLSYNVQQVKGSDVMKIPDANLVNDLNGKIAGVTINSSSSGIGGSSRVVMRGAKSINGNNNVLYVIDGIPMPDLKHDQPGDVFSGAGQTGDAMSGINAEDVESISVLSGPSAAALYGSDASNGVILITTKKGAKGSLAVTYTSNCQFSHPFVMPDFQNTYGPSEVGSYYSWGSKLSKASSYKPKDFFRTGTNFTNSVNVSTGTERNQTYMSLGSTNAGGIIHNNDYDRYNFSVRNTSKFLNDKMTLDLSYMMSSVKEENMISQGLYFNPIVEAYLFPPGDQWEKVTYYERYNADRNFPVQYWPYGDNGLSMQNPYWIAERDKFVNHKERHMATASLKWDVRKWISLHGRVKYDNSTERYEKKYSASTNTLFASKFGHYALNHEKSRQLYAEAFATINKYFANQTWNFTSTIGTSFDQRDYDQDGFDGNLKSVANLFTLSNVATAEAKTQFTQSGYTTRKEAVYGSAQLGYKSKAYVDVTARNDWSSKLEQANNSYFYYSAGISGIFTDIFPAIKSDIMPYFKARLSYSEVGNDPDVP